MAVATPMNLRHAQHCIGVCSSCKHAPPCDREQHIKCPNCSRYFVSKTCFNKHKELAPKELKTVCEKLFKCKTCYKTIREGMEHTCNSYYCKTCKKNRPDDHLCYMPVDSITPNLRDFLFIFYDLECTQNKRFSDFQTLHEPNLCVFNQRCEICLNEPLEKIICTNCAVRQQILKFSDVIERLVYYILEIRKRFKHVIVLAHNGQAYDHQFILNYILTKTELKPELIMHKVFDMQKEIVSYCVSDVNILTTACLKFRDLLIQAGNICPFSEACTIASSCNKLFRRNFLKADTIGLIPRNGYRYRDNQSKIAIEWLIWEEKVREINILHAAKGKEIVLDGLPVDGFCAETNQVFEMMGCFYHGCVKCFKNDRDKPVYNNSGETMNLRYENTRSKITRLNELGKYDSYPYGFKKVKKGEGEEEKTSKIDIVE
ncbi:hypothetical protein PPYR_06496 [Photinus pyralis]|uniref:Uncharacterized protein n=1 Tax=Photinus pyralis TaxID=7054 RepID=A0A5N4ATU8_PHOPY|nr:hypothetical protein PPYR_06496 [Photinus pyralis]